MRLSLYITITLILLTSCSTLTVVSEKNKSGVNKTYVLDVLYYPRDRISFGDFNPKFSDDSASWQVNETIHQAIMESLALTKRKIMAFTVSHDRKDAFIHRSQLNMGQALLILGENDVQMDNGMALSGIGFLMNKPNTRQVDMEPYAILEAIVVFPGEKGISHAYNARFVGGKSGEPIQGVAYHDALAAIPAEEKELLRTALQKEVRRTVNALLTDLNLGKEFPLEPVKQ